MTWARAGVMAILATVVMVLLFFYAPHWILTHVPALSRGVRAWLATGWSLAALALATWVGWRWSRPPDEHAHRAVQRTDAR
jgi:type VI protein secretion system component VasK